MDMLMIILNNEEDTDPVLQGLLDIGVRGATIIESTGMGRTLCTKVPMFGGLRTLFQECRPTNKTIFSVIRTKEKLREAIEFINSKLNLEKPGTGFMFVLPVSEAYGFASALDSEQK
ncbi:MAG: hypothetical protein KGZ63_12190 [Clostridiales bacterium]|jgi:nitrogen regulatory protein PII|nr:hypothetical protein [Clostridiales bacterium]